jgi:hypothetical protein
MTRERDIMRTTWGLCVWLCVGLAGRVDARQPTSRAATTTAPAEFDLLIGERSFPIVPDLPTTITTPDGRRLDVVLKPREVLTFSGYGVRFQYFRQIRINVEKDIGFVTITAETTSSVAAIIQAYSLPVSLLMSEQDVRDGLIEGVMEGFESAGIRQLKKSVVRTIAGKQRKAQILEFTLAGLSTRVEVYAFKHKGRCIGLVLQRDQEDAKEAERHFELITRSLESITGNAASRPAETAPTPE